MSADSNLFSSSENLDGSSGDQSASLTAAFPHPFSQGRLPGMNMLLTTNRVDEYGEVGEHLPKFQKALRPTDLQHP